MDSDPQDTGPAVAPLGAPTIPIDLTEFDVSEITKCRGPFQCDSYSVEGPAIPVGWRVDIRRGIRNPREMLLATWVLLCVFVFAALNIAFPDRVYESGGFLAETFGIILSCMGLSGLLFGFCLTGKAIPLLRQSKHFHKHSWSNGGKDGTGGTDYHHHAYDLRDSGYVLVVL